MQLPIPIVLRLSARVLIVAALVAITGCEDSGPKTYRVSGTVTWNGAAIPEGDIIFSPLDGQTVPGAGKIKDGKYELQVAPGEKKVEVHASRPGTEVDALMGAAPPVPYIPWKYNAQTELKATVQASNDNVADFSLSE